MKNSFTNFFNDIAPSQFRRFDKRTEIRVTTARNQNFDFTVRQLLSAINTTRPFVSNNFISNLRVYNFDIYVEFVEYVSKENVAISLLQNLQICYSVFVNNFIERLLLLKIRGTSRFECVENCEAKRERERLKLFKI